MVNRYKPHVYILPEDDAYRQVAQTTLLWLDTEIAGKCQVLRVAGGWLHVKDLFLRDHVSPMRQNASRHIILLVDCDNDPNRFEQIRSAVPDDLQDRVFILGSLDEAESLKPHFGSLDQIGSKLANDLSDATLGAWNHPLLAISVPDVKRMQAKLCPESLSGC